MWYLISSNDTAVKYSIFVGQASSVGRKDTTIVIGDDPTVSRKHAVLQVTHPESNLGIPSRLPQITLKDESRFGTWINNAQIQSKGQITLKDGDQIRFGSPKSTFMCVYKPFVISTSCLDATQKRSVRGLVAKLGGHIVREWQKDCALLVMSSVSVTVKVVCAMVSLKPIVTPNYLTALQEALSLNKQPPDPQDFGPELNDTHLNPADVSFEPNPDRKTLFQGKSVVFLNATQFKKLSLTVEMAGGTPLLQETDNKSNDFLLHDDTIVMNSDPTDLILSSKVKQWVSKVQALLKRSKKRMIPDSEIGYAVVFCSIDRHCNPDHNPVEDLGIGLPSQSLSEKPFADLEEVLASNTEISQYKRLSGKARLEKDIKPKVVPNTAPEENEAVMLKSSSRETTTSQAPDLEDFSADVKQTELVSTPRSSLRKRPREKDSEIESLPFQKSARRNEDETAVEIKTEILSQKEKDEEIFTEDLPDQNLRGTQRGLTEGKKKNLISKEGNSSDDMGPPSNPRRSRQTVLVQDTEVDDYGVSKRRRVSSAAGKSRISDSDPDCKPAPEKDAINTRQESSSDDMMSPQPQQTKRGRKSEKVSIKSEPVSINIDEHESLNADQISDDNENAFTSAVKKRVKTSPVDISDENIKTKKKDSLTPKQLSPKCIEPKTKEQSERGASGSDDSESHTDLNPRLRLQVPTGFLTTRLPIKGQVRQTENFDREEVSVQISIEFKSLVFRQPKSNVSSRIQSTDSEGYVIWKGKRVKNFKKFKKSSHAGAGMLPQIIGGRDLEAHENNPRRELDDWYRDAVQAESQRTEDVRMASQLFDWDRVQRSTKTKGRRSR